MTAVAFWLMTAVTVVGALTVLAARETIRLVMGLGAFLLGIAGLYLFYAMPLLAGAQVFLYVGGVLVLFLFAIMALRRDGDSERGLERRFAPVPAATCAGLFAVLVTALYDVGLATASVPLRGAGVDQVGSLLLGDLLPAFELVGGLLLVALVAAVAITGREGER